MFKVYEVFNNDGKRFLVYQHRYKFDCLCWIENHRCSWSTVVNQKAHFEIEFDASLWEKTEEPLEMILQKSQRR